ELVEEYVVEEKPPDGQRRPLATAHRAECFGRQPDFQGSDRHEARKAHSRRQGAERNLTMAAGHVAERPRASAAVVEVDGPKPCPKFHRKAGQNDPDVLFRDVVDAVSSGS